MQTVRIVKAEVADQGGPRFVPKEGSDADATEHCTLRRDFALADANQRRCGL